MERRIDIDILRGIGIIAVVLGHCSICSKFVYLFHIPLFVFISGMLAGYCESKEMKTTTTEVRKNFFLDLRKKVARLYFPFVTIQLFFLIFHNIFVKYHLYSSEMLSGFEITSKIFNIVSLGGGESLGGALWFLICLFEISVLWEILKLFRCYVSPKLFRICLMILAVALYCVGMKFNLPRSINISFYLFIYYVLGWGCSIYSFFKKESKMLWVIFIVFVGLLILGMNKEISYNNVNTPVLAFIMAFAGIFCSVFVAKQILKVSVLAKILGICGIYSFSIMAFHFTGFKILAIIRYFAGISDVSSLSNLCPAKTLNICVRFLYCFLGIFFSIGVSYGFHKLGKCFPNILKYLTGQWLLPSKEYQR